MRLHFFTSAVIANSKMDYSDYRAIALGSKPPLVAQRAQTGLGTRLGNPVNKGQLSLSCQKAHIPYK